MSINPETCIKIFQISCALVHGTILDSSAYEDGLLTGFICVMHFDEISDQVKIWNAGQRREGTSSNL